MAVTGTERPSHGDSLPGSSRRGILATAKGGGFLAGGSLATFASRFVIAIILARFLGADEYGLYNLAISAGTIFAGISALGLDDAMVRYIAILAGRRNEAGVWGTVQIGVAVSGIAGVVMGAVLFFAATPIASGLFDEPRLVPLLKLFAFLVPFLTMSNVLLGVSRGFGRMDHAALAENVIQNLFRMVMLGVLAVVGLDVMSAAIVFGIADVAATVAQIALINSHFPLKRPISTGVERPVRDVFGFAMPLWMSGLINQFRKNIETILLGALSVAANVGIFAIVTRVNLISHMMHRAIIVSVKPVFARYHDQGDRRGLADVYTATTRWSLIVNLPFFLVMVLYAEPLLSIFGKAFAAGAPALVLLALAELLLAGTGTCGSLLDMAGHTRVKLFNSVFWIITLLVSNILLIPRWGVLGAAAASLIATGSVNLLRLIEVWIIERLQPYRWHFLKPMAAAAAGFGLGWVLARMIPIDSSIFMAMAQGVAVLGMYAIVLLLLGVEDDDRLVASRVLRRFGSAADRMLPSGLATRWRGARS